MVSCFISRLVILVFGTLYPAYASYKAVRTKNVKEYVKWMMYWIVFALFTCAETFTDLFLSFWFPFYYEIKIITVIYLLSPATKGSSILYRKFVHPVLTKREQEIDEYIAKAKEQGYHTMLNLGSKGVTYATSLIMQTAIKGGGGLVSQLKKSYSLGDLSEEQHLRNQKRESEDDVDSQYDEDPRVLRRLPVRSPRRTISSASQSGLYFPEVDPDQRHIGEHMYGQIPSSEEISSGYSSGDPLYYGMAGSEGSHLVRTASLGATSRVRTRAASRNGLPKRASLSEGGSTRSALEPSESQIEIERYYNLSPSHSAPISFPFASFSHLVRPEYQHLFGNVTQNQMFTFINHSQYSQPLNNNTLVNVESETLGSPSVVISEANEHPSDSDRPPSIIPEAVANPDIKVDQSVVETQIQDRTVAEKTEGKAEVDSVEKCGDEKEKDKQLHERSGKYNKKPAPTPPVEESNAESGPVVEEEEESEFCTPSASPTPVRKHDFPAEKTAAADENEAKVRRAEVVDVPRKNRPKTKKGEFNISKKLHMPKMSFSFWNQKSGKHSSGSEISLVGNAEGDKRKSEDKSESEVFIPLRDSDEKENAAEDETKTDASQRQN